MPEIYGTLGHDIIIGTTGSDEISGLDGDDTIQGGDGEDVLNDDWINGGPGNDVLYGGAGGDMIYDESGNDTVYAGSDRDLIYGSSGDDYYDGGTGYDYIGYNSALAGILVDLSLSTGQVRSLQTNDVAFVGVDTLYNIEYIGGTTFNDRMTGDAGDTRFWGDDGNDTLIGGDGSDELLGGNGNDLLDGGAGFDQAIYAGLSVGVAVSLAVTGPQNTGHGTDTLTRIESLRGTYYDDHLTGNEEANLLVGDPGNDVLNGGGGADTIDGGPGHDILTGGSGADDFTGDIFALSGDVITDFSLDDTITFTGIGYPGSFTFSLSGSTLTFNGQSLTFSSPLSGRLVATIFEDSVQLSLSQASSQGAANDFNGDGRSDVLWRNESSGDVTNWLTNANGGFAGNTQFAYNNSSSEWQIAGTGDFNGDGFDDILWRNDNGRVTNWLGNANGGFNGNIANAESHADNTWEIVGTGDFNGDGRDDVLWRNSVSGDITNWLCQPNGGFAGNTQFAYNNSSSEWHVAGVGDFNGDGRDDILWRNDNGRVTNWLGNANGGFNGNIANAESHADNTWEIVGVGDFNGDGRDDVLWRNSVTGDVTNWLCNANGSFSGNTEFAYNNASLEWHVIGTGDFNGDGRDDILWRNDNGRVTNWLGNANGGFNGNIANAESHADNTWHVYPQDYVLV